ncbi:MAG: TlpA family protein disulfide reductase [Acidobacteriales bacterium]|nr:TlpA family protein disulfide reductase [Terriglobales bacterium]
MKRNPAVLVVVAIVVTAMLVIGVRMSHKQGAAAGGGTDVAGTPAPEFSLESLQGKTVHLSDYRGKAVLLNFWATWCEPCKVEMPWFVELQKKYGADGLQIVGIAMDDASPADIEKFAKQMGVNYPVLIGKEAVGQQYGGVPFLPTTFYIGRDGKIVAKVFGLKGRSEIEDTIKRALATQQASN